MNPARFLRAVSLVDRFSQTRYRQLTVILLTSIHRLTLCVCLCLWIPSGIDVTRVCGHA